MYINKNETHYDTDGQMHTKQGDFLILMQKDDWSLKKPHEINAIVRKVALRQCGQWLMGYVRIGGETHVVSGPYGSDGLPLKVPDHIFEMGVQISEELYELWNTGGGWNSAGKEAPAMRLWANENIGLLVSKSDRRSTQ